MKFVLLPREQEEAVKELKNWDLWGPLLLCIVLSSALNSLLVATFVLVWGGAGVVTLNAQLLGSKVSFFQSVCVLGYCVFPIALASLLCLLNNNTWYRLAVVLCSFVWATRASVVFMSQLVVPERRMLAVYPALLFYAMLCWMVFDSSKGEVESVIQVK